MANFLVFSAHSNSQQTMGHRDYTIQTLNQPCSDFCTILTKDLGISIPFSSSQFNVSSKKYILKNKSLTSCFFDFLKSDFQHSKI